MAKKRGSKAASRKGGNHGRLRAAYRAALEFLSREPWLQLGNEDYVVLELDGDPDPLVAVVMGAAGEEFGLMVACGPKAEAQVQRMMLGSVADEGLIECMYMLALYVDRLNRLPDFMRAELKRAGLKAKGRTRVPYYMSKRPYHHLERVAPRDLQRLHAVVRGLVIAQDRGWLDPGAYVRPRLRLVGDPLVPAGEPGALDIQQVMASGEVPPDGALPAGSEPLPSLAWTVDHQDIAGLPMLKETWCLLLVAMPGRVVGSSEVLRAFMVLEAETALMLGMHVVSGPRGAVKAIDHLLEVFRGQGKFARPGIQGIPETLEVFDRELLGLLKPVLEPAGVTCRYQTKIPPEVEHLLAGLNEFMARPDRDAELDPWVDDPVRERAFGLGDDGLGDDANWSGDPTELACPDDGNRDSLPAPGDLGGWKAVDRRLIQRAMRTASTGLTGSKRLTARYFGGAEPRDRLMERLDESPELPFLMSFQEWHWLDYRKNNREPTLAEHMLAGQDGGPLPRAERVVLEALSAAPMSLQRVVTVEPGQSLVLEDVLRGGRCLVTDRSLSRTAKPGLVFPGRVFPVGDYNFVSGAGLVIPQLRVGAVLEQLREWGLRTTPAALRRGAHLFGRLWDFVFMQPTMPRIKTTDDEDMVLHEATFRVQSPKSARTALRSHPDYDHDPSANVHVWLEARPGSAVDPVVLGRFQLDGDRLRFSTNSAPRWQRAKAWVERALPDAVLEDLQLQKVTSFEQLGATGPPGTEPAEISPEPELSAEDMEALRQALQQRQLRWCDEKIPLLDGRTPREAVRTKVGRRQVQQILRTFPPAMGPGDIAIEPPVAEIRRQLGLPPEDEGVSTAVSDPSGALAPTRRSSHVPAPTRRPSPAPDTSPLLEDVLESVVRHDSDDSPRGTMFDDRNARKRTRRKQKKGRKGKKGSGRKKK